MEVREHKSTFLVYSLLQALVIIVGITAFFQQNYEHTFLCILTLILMTIPEVVQLEFKIELPTTLEIIILLFIFAAEILGEIFNFYQIFPLWDTVLHTMNGFLAAAVGFSMVNLLNHTKSLEFRLSPVFVCLVAFCFSMTIGVMWEFFEFTVDHTLGKDMQKDTWITEIRSVELDPDRSNVPYKISDIHSVVIDGVELPYEGYLDVGLYDTMEDLFVNFVGALVFSLGGYFYLEYDRKKSGRFVAQFVPKVKTEEQDYMAQAIHEAEEKEELRYTLKDLNAAE